MKHLATLVAALLLATILHAGDLPRSTPEAQGVSSAALLQFIDAADKIDAMHSIMIVRHGHVIAEGWWAPYDAKTRHELYSLSKSFTSTAVGLAVAEGKLNIDDPVLKFFPDEAPAEPSNNLKSMRVRDLLCMSTGHQTEPQLAANQNQSWVKTFLAHSVAHKPGTHFMYNTPATYMQSAIVQKVTGKTVLDYLTPRLFEPLGIHEPTWGKSPQGVSLGGYGLNVRTEDIAKFGQLYLQKGKWGDKQLIPAAWIEQATSKQTSNGSSPKSDWDQGYGYQFWRCRHNGFRGDGAFGQYCIVLPEQDTVIAITSGVKDMQATLNLIWDTLLPALQSASLPPPPDPQANEKLKQRLASLSVQTLPPAALARIPEHLAGKQYILAANDQKIESISLEMSKPEDIITLVTKGPGGFEQKLFCGNGAWHKTRFAYGLFPEQQVAACGVWTSPDTYVIKICFYETPYMLTLNLNFTDNKLKLDGKSNVSFGNAKMKQLVGESK